MIKAVLFDMDGVLVDSSRTRVKYKELLFEKAGYKDIEQSLLLDSHRPIKQVIEGVLASKEVTSRDELERIFKIAEDGELRDKIQHLYRFPKNIDGILCQLHKKYKLGIVTSRVRVGVQEIFDHIPIADLFDIIVDYQDTEHHKPHPEPLSLACERLMIKPGEAIFIGDNESDMLAAHALTMPFIHFSCETYDKTKHRVKDFSQLPDTIQLIADENHISA